MGFFEAYQLTKNENLRGGRPPRPPCPPQTEKEKLDWTTPAGWKRSDITDELGHEMKA